MKNDDNKTIYLRGGAWYCKKEQKMKNNTNNTITCPVCTSQFIITKNTNQESANHHEEIARVPKNMVLVEAGRFLCGRDKHVETIEEDYYIDKYLVTNGDYALFMKAGGYNNENFWSEDGWKWRVENNITEPKHWHDTKYNHTDHPVVGVSHYEAEAYAKWAGKELPTEKQWERAARGTDGREYPWGDKFDSEKCNIYESGKGATTPVYKYDNGVSPEGCYDMAGNVWEWTK